MRNLSAAIYRDHKLYLIECTSGQESLKLEKHLKNKLKPKNIRGEWFASIRPECVQSLLVDDFAHLLLTSSEPESPTPVPHLNQSPPDFNITLS
jgi:hypothetical protein